ncbi:hypothetical protein WP1_279 [Pseudomonas phage WP1]
MNRPCSIRTEIQFLTGKLVTWISLKTESPAAVGLDKSRQISETKLPVFAAEEIR